MRLLAACLLLGLATPCALAQPLEPERGSADRTAILSEMRSAVRASGLDGSVEFHDVWIRVEGDWAFFEADVKRPGGRSLSEDVCPFDPIVEALLHRQRNGWVVALPTWGVPWCQSDDSGVVAEAKSQYRLPGALFPPKVPY